MSKPLDDRCHFTAPGLDGIRNLHSEVRHQTAATIALLEEPAALQRRASNPVQHVSVDLRSYRFHEVVDQAVTSGMIHVQQAESGIQSERSDCEPGFGLQQRVQVIENRIDRVGWSATCAGDGRSTRAERAPVVR